MSAVCAAAKDWGEPDKAIMIMTTMCRRSDLNCIWAILLSKHLERRLSIVLGQKGP
jgi:hypothetical protein